MAPTWRRSSTTESDNARELARQAARQRRDICMEIRSYLSTLYPSYPNLTIRSQQSAGAAGQPCYIGLVLYESTQSSRLSASNPVINTGEQYYDDRLLTEGDMARYTVLLSGTPGVNQTDGMNRLLERVEVLVRSGWRAG